LYKLKKLRSNSATSVLFVGRENAARSLIAEACLRHLGQERFQVFSCGTPGKTLDKPSDWALLALQQAGISTEGLHCKDWSAFARRGALPMDYVVALDAAAMRAHPPWPGQPEQALWSFAPLIDKKCSGMKLGLAAIQTLHALRLRIELLVNLHARAASPQDLRHDLRDLGQM
jgi:protein-tyrosine-phosphatase